MMMSNRGKHTEIFNKVRVEYDKETGILWIDDYDTNEQLAVFYVTEED